MFDNNLILLIAIGVVIFFIINLNSKKSKKHCPEKFEVTTVSAPTSVSSIPKVSQPIQSYLSPSDQTIINNVLSVMPTQVSSSVPLAPSSQSALDSLYGASLKGVASPSSFDSNITKLDTAASFGSSFGLGVNTSDPSLSKYTSQAPIQQKQLISDDLLPKKNESWFETPSVGTKVDDANLLADAVYKVGVDTIGSSRKNPSYDIRGNVANPKFAVSPWNNSSYEPDNSLKGFC